MSARRIIATVAGLVMLAALGTSQAWSVWTGALQREFHITNLQSQMVFTASMVMFSLTLILAGRLHDRFGPRAVAAASAVIVALGLLLAWRLGQHFPVLLLSMGVLVGLGNGMGYVCPIATAIKWFPHHRGAISGLAAAAYGGGPILLTALAGATLSRGWYVLDVYGLMLAIYTPAILISALLLFTPPVDVRVGAIGSGPRGLLRDRRFWMLFVGMLTGTWPYQVLMGSIKPMAGEWGLVALMGMAIGIAAAGNATGRIVWGMTLDRIGYLRTHRLAQVLAVAATLLMLIAGHSGPVFVLSAVLIGACYGSNFAIFPATVAKLYGVEHIGAVYSWIMTAQAIAALGAMLNGFLRDLTGSYLPGLATTVAMAIAGLVACAILARSPRPDEQPRPGQAPGT